MKYPRHCLTLVLATLSGVACGSSDETRVQPDALSDVGMAPAPDAASSDASVIADARLPEDRAPMPDGGNKDTVVRTDAPVSLDVATADTRGADTRVADSRPKYEVSPVDVLSGCSYGGREYASGETFKVDCNTCTCQSNGSVACTLMACPDAAAATCKLPTALTFGYDGGNALYRDVNRIDVSGLLTITRTMSGRGGGDGGSTSCAQALAACGTAGAVTADTLAADLANADVKTAFAASTILFYGVDQRPADGPAYSVAQADGHSILVGSPCPASGGGTCRGIPAGVQRLVDDLKKAASIVLSSSVCQGL